MFGDGALAFSEFVTRERLPLATIHDAILQFLRGRDDAVVFGAQAVNAYVDEPRMTQDIAIQSTRAAALAEELRERLAGLFHIAVRVREVAGGRGYRVYELQEPRNRHLADVRKVERLPPARRIAEVWIAEPADLVAGKVTAYQRRIGRPKAFTDRRDVAGAEGGSDFVRPQSAAGRKTQLVTPWSWKRCRRTLLSNLPTEVFGAL